MKDYIANYGGQPTNGVMWKRPKTDSTNNPLYMLWIYLIPSLLSSSSPYPVFLYLAPVSCSDTNSRPVCYANTALILDEQKTIASLLMIETSEFFFMQLPASQAFGVVPDWSKMQEYRLMQKKLDV